MPGSHHFRPYAAPAAALSAAHRAGAMGDPVHRIGG